MDKDKPIYVQYNRKRVDIAKMSRVELLQLKTAIESEIDAVKEHIFRAEAEYKINRQSSPEQSDWYASAVRAKRHKSRDAQRIQLRLHEIRKAEIKSFADTFIDMAKIFLSEETFAMLIERTKEEVGYQE